MKTTTECGSNEGGIYMKETQVLSTNDEFGHGVIAREDHRIFAVIW